MITLVLLPWDSTETKNNFLSLLCRRVLPLFLLLINVVYKNATPPHEVFIVADGENLKFEAFKDDKLFQADIAIGCLQLCLRWYA